MSCPISNSGALALELPSRPSSVSSGTRTTATRELRTITLIAFLGLLLSGYNNFVAAIAMVGIQSTLHPTPVVTGLVLAATFVGMLLGGAALGHVADHRGRRVAMLLNMSLIALFAIASALVADTTQLVIMRLLTGVGIGASYPIGASYVADMAPTHRRGAQMTLAFSGWGVGALAAALAGWLSIELLPLHLAWRAMLASGALPALLTLAVVLLRGLPESAAWHQGRTHEPLPVRTLLAPPYRRRTVAALLPWFLMDLPVYGIGLLVPTLLTQLRIGGSQTVVIITAALSALTLVGFALAYATIDRLGRRCLQIMGFAGDDGAVRAAGAAGCAPGCSVASGAIRYRADFHQCRTQYHHLDRGRRTVSHPPARTRPRQRHRVLAHRRGQWCIFSAGHRRALRHRCGVCAGGTGQPAGCRDHLVVAAGNGAPRTAALS